MRFRHDHVVIGDFPACRSTNGLQGPRKPRTYRLDLLSRRTRGSKATTLSQNCFGMSGLVTVLEWTKAFPVQRFGIEEGNFQRVKLSAEVNECQQSVKLTANGEAWGS